MWVRIDDALPGHRKIFTAAAHLGRHGYARVLSVIIQGLCYASHNLTDGFIPDAVVDRFQDRNPGEIATVLALKEVGIWERIEGGFQVHDYGDYQPSKQEALAVKELRSRVGRIGGLKSAEKRKQTVKQTVAKQTATKRNPVPSRPQDLDQKVDSTALSNTECSEALTRSEPPKSPVMVFPTVGNHGSSWSLLRPQVAKWQECYGMGVDVLAECRKAHVWLDANPGRRKTMKGMPKFLVNWLNRAVDVAGRNLPTTSTTTVKPTGGLAVIQAANRAFLGRGEP